MKRDRASSPTSGRVAVAKAVETRLLTESRRRCCLCAFLELDWSEKRVQIAHISRNSEDSRYENLAVLCLDHHDRYDSTPSTSKGYTPGELRHYKARLVEVLERWEEVGNIFLPPAIATSRAAPESTETPPTSRNQPNASGTIPIEDVITLLTILESDPQGTSVEVATHPAGDRSVRVATINPEFGRWQFGVAASKDRAAWLAVDSQFSYCPSIRLVEHPDGFALVLRRLTFHGTGAEEVSEVWYVVANGALNPILDYPISAHVSGFGVLDRSIRVSVRQEPARLVAGATLRLSVRADYFVDLSAEDSFLFAVERDFEAAWDEEAGLFVPGGGKQAAEDLHALFGEAEEQFIARNHAAIVGLLESGAQIQREWAKSILAPRG